MTTPTTRPKTTKTTAKAAKTPRKAPMKQPTPETYDILNKAFQELNRRFFRGELPPVLITFRRAPRARAYYSPGRFFDKAQKVRKGDEPRATGEIALDATFFAQRTDLETLSTLLHEMCHHWEWTCSGHTPTGGYHDKVWAAKMVEVGLIPTDTGELGGKMTGKAMTHIIAEGGKFAQIGADMIKAGRFHLTWADVAGRPTVEPKGQEPKLATKGATKGQPIQVPGTRGKFTCPSCGANAWGKPSLRLTCTGTDLAEHAPLRMELV
jgi:hypothetical protein